MRWILTTVLTACTALATLPARAVGGWATVASDGIASAQEGSRLAVITIQDIAAAANSDDDGVRRQPWLCVSLQDAGAGLWAGTCTEAPFTIDPLMRSASATGSVPVEIRRLRDGVTIGNTVIRYDVDWVRMAPPYPRAYGGAELCAGHDPRFVGLAAVPTFEVVNFGSAEGGISSPALGSVRVADDTLTWDTFLGQGVAVAGWHAGDIAGSELLPEGCHDAQLNPIPLG